MDTGNVTLRTNATVYEVTVDPNTGKASGVSFIDTDTKKTLSGERQNRSSLGASTLESARLMLLSKSRQHPNGIGNLERACGPQFLRARHGAQCHGLGEGSRGKPRTLDDGRPGGFYLPRFRNLKEKNPKFIRGYGFEGGAARTMIPGNAFSTSGFRRRVQETGSRPGRRLHRHGRIRRSAAAL